MRLPEGWSEAEVLRCAAEILDRGNWRLVGREVRDLAQVLETRQKLAASAVTDAQGEKEAGGDSVLKEGEGS